MKFAVIISPVKVTGAIAPAASLKRGLTVINDFFSTAQNIEKLPPPSEGGSRAENEFLHIRKLKLTGAGIDSVRPKQKARVFSPTPFLMDIIRERGF